MQPRVYLIGGAPGVGKTTLGRALATSLDLTSLSIDDLMTAARAVTTPASHPGLHVMSRVPHVEYFTNNSPEQLVADAEEQHAAAWQVVEPVIRKYAKWGPGIVIDGWHLRPDRILGLGREAVWAGWIVADEEVLEERERKNTDWLQGSPDPDRMLCNFLARSHWFNELMREQTTRLGLNVLHQPGDASVDDLLASIPRANSST